MAYYLIFTQSVKIYPMEPEFGSDISLEKSSLRLYYFLLTCHSLSSDPRNLFSCLSHSLRLLLVLSSEF